jgi:hypothetical protein
VYLPALVAVLLLSGRLRLYPKTAKLSKM